MSAENNNSQISETILKPEDIIKELAATFAEQIISTIESRLKDARDAEDRAKAALKDAVDAYTGDLAARRDALQDKISSVKDQLDECMRQKQQAVDALSDALSNDDTAEEDRAKSAVDDAAQKEFIARQRYDALSLVKLSGKDNLVMPVINAFAARAQADSADGNLESLVCMLINEMIDRHENLRATADGHISRFEVRARNATRVAWPVVEAHVGKVDFSHSHSGDDLDCQQRFIEALYTRRFDEAFIDSPAGDVLMQAMKKLATIEAEQQ